MEPFEFIKILYKKLENKLSKTDKNKFVIQQASKKGNNYFQFTYTLSIYVKTKLNTNEEKGIVIGTNAQNQSHFSRDLSNALTNFYMCSDILLIEGEGNTEITSTEEFVYSNSDKVISEDQKKALINFFEEGYKLIKNFITENS